MVRRRGQGTNEQVCSRNLEVFADQKAFGWPAFARGELYKWNDGAIRILCHHASRSFCEALDEIIQAVDRGTVDVARDP